jgi:hypothetical protein
MRDEYAELYFDLDAPIAQTKAALHRYGCFVLRGAVDATNHFVFHETTLRLFEEDQTDYGRDIIVRERGWCSGSYLAKLVLGDENGFARLLSRPRLAEHLGNILEDTPALHPLTSVRYRSPKDPGTALPFHQHPHHTTDGELTLNRTRFIGITVPFTRYDGTCSDLELITVPLQELLPPSLKPETQFAAFEIDRGMVLDRFGNHRWRPKLEEGDLIVFRECTLHRSYLDPATMSRPRASVDVRVFNARDPIGVFRGADGITLPDLNRIKAPE